MPVSCDIEFDENASGMYYGGQTLSGHVKLTLSKPKKVKDFHLKISGDAGVSWPERVSRSVNGHRQWRTVNFLNFKPYVKTLVRFGDHSPTDSNCFSSGTFELPEGSRTFYFSHVLPDDLPSSFEGKFGNRRYEVRVCLERPWKFDHIFKKSFLVSKRVDLNLLPNLKFQAMVEKERNFCCWLCGSGPLVISAGTPMTGYISGQRVHVMCNVFNNSRVDVDHLRILLNQVVQYYSETPCKKEKEDSTVLYAVRCNGIMRRTVVRYEEDLLLPRTTPTTTLTPDIIQIKYEIQITALFSGRCQKNLVLTIPITVGDIPFRFDGNHPQLYSVAEEEYAPPSAPPMPESPDYNPNEAPPPSYEECKNLLK